MRTYKRIVSLAIGLAIMLLYGGLCARLINPDNTFYQGLVTPQINTTFDSIIWFIIYCFMALLIGECIRVKEIRKLLILWAFNLLLSIIWIISFFDLQNIYMGAVAVFFAAAITVEMLFLYTKNTRLLGFLMVPVTVWYIYLFIISFLVILLNK